ncbi:hypothetical protein M0R45_000371 [Rubus argutus]|uniref:RNase H type-1 domain-containing protein n=1 Tax=Rubus argutus TaxID=59490 RepID=A0AAW1VKZ7_RUBAR
MAMGSSGQAASVSRNDVCWCPPLPEVLKINCDGSVSNSREQVGVGAIVRNDLESFIGAVGQLIYQRLDPYTCELVAIKVGLEFAWSMVCKLWW